MYYRQEQFKQLDEAHAIADSLQDFAPKLYETLNAANADLKKRYPHDLFSDSQNRVNLPRLVNQRCARIWNDNDDRWSLFDRCGYFHLEETASGLRTILRRVDPVSGGLPKANATKASRAYYMQSACKGVGELKVFPQHNLFADDDEVSPDLSDTKLILAWQETAKGISVTAYRPRKPVPYGYQGPAEYDFCLELTDNPVQVRDFTPIEDNDDNLLPSLIIDDISENETARNTPER